MTQKFVKIDERFDDMDSRLGQIEQAVHRIEENQTEETIGLLRTIARRLEEKDLQFQALNKRLFKVETEIERFAK